MDSFIDGCLGSDKLGRVTVKSFRDLREFHSEAFELWKICASLLLEMF